LVFLAGVTALLVGASCGRPADARDAFCRNVQDALAAPLAADVGSETGVRDYRDRMIQIEQASAGLDAGDRSSLSGPLSELIELLDASVVRRASLDGWSSAPVMEVIWGWCGMDVGVAYTVQP